MPSTKLLAAGITVAALALIPAGLAAASTDGDGGRITTKIVGGTNATQTYSFMGSIQDRRGGHHCGTTLISSDWAVTAGHCVLDENQQPVDPSLMVLRFGSNDRSSGGQVVGVSKIVVHPEYPSQGTHDIALMQLANPVPLAPAKIAGASPQPGTIVRLLGWGQTCPQPGCQQNAPRILQQLDVRVLSAGCTAGFDPSFELCLTGTTNRTACYGDSGGPALVNTPSGVALVGATSRGGSDNPVCGSGNAIYTDVTAFRDFITQATGQATGQALAGSPRA